MRYESVKKSQMHHTSSKCKRKKNHFLHSFSKKNLGAPRRQEVTEAAGMFPAFGLSTKVQRLMRQWKQWCTIPGSRKETGATWHFVAVS